MIPIRSRAWLACVALALAGCGQQQAEPVAAGNVPAVTGSVTKGPLQGATIDFYAVDAAGNLTGAPLVSSLTTDADGRFSVSGLPAGVPVLVKTSGGSYLDESDTQPDPALRRRITFLAGEHLMAVLPPGETSLAITPYSMALYKKALIQANGGNFANVYEAVRQQAIDAFGFDPILTLPADPATGAGGDPHYAMILGAAAQAINAIATTAGHLPGHADVMAFVNDLGTDGDLEPPLDLNAEIRRFRNNNLGVYGGTAQPFVDEALLGTDAPVPNGAPVANADSILVAEGGTVTVLADGSTASVLANDTDPEGQALSATLVGSPGFATAFTLNTDGTFSYQHDGGETASDGFDYVANDGTDDSVAATVSVTIAAVNDAPVLDVNDALTVAEGDAADLSGFLSVSDADNLATELTYAVTGGPAAGTLLRDGSTPVSAFTQDELVAGRISYDHAGGESATDTVTFTVSDAGAAINTIGPFTFTVNVLGLNDLPTINDQVSGLINEDSNTGSLDFTIGDAETALTALVFSATSSNQVLVPDTNFSYADDGDGDGAFRDLTVTPAPNEYGTVTITVAVDDANGGSAFDTFDLTVAPVSDAPSSQAFAIQTDENLPYVFGTAEFNFSDAVDASGDGTDEDSFDAVIVTSLPTNGSLVIDDGVTVTPITGTPFSVATAAITLGHFQFVPDEGETGVPYASFTFKVRDSGSTANGGVIDSIAYVLGVDVLPVNDAPVALADSYSTAAGTTLLVDAADDPTTPLGLLANDTDAEDGAPATAANASAPLCVPDPAPAVCSLDSFGSDGSFTFTPPPGFSGTMTFSYEAVDSLGAHSAPAIVTVTVGPSTESLLPYLTAGGDLKLFDPADPANPLLLASGQPADIGRRSFLRADITGSVATNLRPARFVYVKDDGSTRTLWKVNLEAGQDHTPVQVSNITDACGLNGTAEDFANPDNSVVRVDTAGADGICGNTDDFTTAEAYLVPLTTPAGSAGVQIGLGHCCGISGIGDATGALVGVLTTEDDGTGLTFDLVRRNVAALGTPIPVTGGTLDIAGTGQVYAHLQRGLGDQHVYLRGSPTGGADGNYRLLRYNVASNDLTELYDYGVGDAALLGDFDLVDYDSASLYFTSASGQELLKVAHAATGPGQATSLATLPGGHKIVELQQAGDRLVFQRQGEAGGVYSVPKAGGSVTTLAVNDLMPTIVQLMLTSGPRVYINSVITSTPEFTAYSVNADGTSASTEFDAQWAGRQFGASCDFNEHCEGSIGLQTVFLRHQAGSTNASLELVDPATSVPTGDLFPTVFNVAEGTAVFGGGFGRFTQLTFLSSAEHLDIWLGDTLAASPAAPFAALAQVENGPGDDQWLLFGDDGAGAPGATDSDGDGLTDTVEAALGTDPAKPDTDNDGLTDFEEVNEDGNPGNYTAGVDTNPNDFDTDDDGMSDGEELAWSFSGSPVAYDPGLDTSPFDADSDDDDVGDGIETDTSSDPLAANTVYRVDCALGATGNDGGSWTDGAGSVGPLANNAEVLGAIGAGGLSPSQKVFVLYKAGTCNGTLALTGATPRQYVVFLGSVGPGTYVPAQPPTTAFTASPGPSVITVSNADNLDFGNIEVFGGNSGTGGGLLVTDADGAVLNIRLHAMRIRDNGAANGGGVAVVAASLNGAELEIEDSEIFSNDVSASTLGSGRGGGIYVQDAATLFVKNSAVRGNTAANTFGPDPTHGGGGIYGENGAGVFVENTILADNKALNGPGGAINLMGVGQADVRDSMLLANSATRPGGGLHMHVDGGGSFAVTNNLVVGNASTDATAHGAGIEIEHNATVSLTVNSNTVAYNQSTTATSPSGGGLTITPTQGAGFTLFRNNIVAFNNDAQEAVEATDNVFMGGTFGGTGNNVLEGSFSGNAATIPNGADPQFLLGFYLDQVTSPSKDSGDGLASDAGNFASGFYTTDALADPFAPSGEDQGTVDSGFHHTSGSAGAPTDIVPVTTLLCSNQSTVVVRPVFAGFPNGQAGHLVAMRAGFNVGSSGSLTTLHPVVDSASVLLRDLGDGTYAFTATALTPGGDVGFHIYVDSGTIAETITVPSQSGPC